MMERRMVNKMFKKVIGLLLVCATFLSMTSQLAFAQELTEVVSETTNVELSEYTLSDLAQALDMSSYASNLSLTQSTLHYTTLDGTNVSISEQIISEGVIQRYITEGNQIDTLTTDYINNKIYLNGNLVIVTEEIVYMTTPEINTYSENGLDPVWTLMGAVSRRSIACEEKVRSISTSALLLLLGTVASNLTPFGGGVALAISLISLAAELAPDTTTIYAEIRMYHDQTYYGYKSVYDYYFDPEYTVYADSHTDIVWT